MAEQFSNHDDSNLDLDNPEFQNLWKLIRFTNESIFLTGKAGTGKSTFLRYICRHTSKRHVVLAPTGIAAVNVGGQTLHSFFKLPFKPLLPDDPEFNPRQLRQRMKYSRAKVKLLQALDLIIIDEISMVRADIIDFIDKILRVFCGNRHLPFGGKQMLFIGDMFQLEPVVTSDMRQILRNYYPNSYFFSAKAFQCAHLVPIELKKVYRQSDPLFISILDKVRSGQASNYDLMMLNSRVARDPNEMRNKMVMTLTTTRDLASSINLHHLEALPGDVTVYRGKIYGDFPESSYPTDFLLELKVGAQVVFLKNDPERRWVNGTLGRVTMLEEDRILVETDENEEYEVTAETWKNLKYELDEEKKEVIEHELGSFTQLPIRLAWALTIHKSQGLTFQNVQIDMGNGAFGAGQTYVALSRSKSMEGLTLSQPLALRDIYANRSVIEFGRRSNDPALVAWALEKAKADACYNAASELVQQGNYYEALRKFLEGLKSRNELNNPATIRLAMTKALGLKDLQQKVTDLEAELEKKTVMLKELAQEYITLGDDCYLELGEYTAAIANYKKALRIDPDNQQAHFQLAAVYEATGQKEKAKKHLRLANKILKKNAGNPGATGTTGASGN